MKKQDSKVVRNDIIDGINTWDEEQDALFLASQEAATLAFINTVNASIALLNK